MNKKPTYIREDIIRDLYPWPKNYVKGDFGLEFLIETEFIRSTNPRGVKKRFLHRKDYIRQLALLYTQIYPD